jgi:hypothetical protein
LDTSDSPQAQLLVLAKQRDRGLERAEQPCEVEMLVLAQPLLGISTA